MISSYRFFSVPSRLPHVLVAALAVCFGVIMVCGCDGGRGKATDAALASAEELMEERPDSALAVLCSIDLAAIDNAGRRALHGLLMAEARYKNFIDETDDSIIAASAAYFGRKGDDRRLMRARFIQAKIQFNNSDYTHSIVSALKAEKLAKQDSDNLYLARIYDHIAAIYNRSYNLEAELPYNQQSSELYFRVGKERNAWFVIAERALAYMNLAKYDDCIILSDSILNSISPSDSVLIGSVLQTKIEALLSIGRTAEATTELERLRDIQNGDISSDFTIPFKVAIAQKNIPESKRYLDLILSDLTTFQDRGYDSTVIASSALFEYNNLIGNKESAITFAKRFMECQYREALSRLNQSVMQAQKDYFMSENNQNSVRVNYMRNILLISITFFLLLISVMIILYRYKLKLKESKIATQIVETRFLLDHVQMKDNELDILNHTVKKREESISTLKADIEDKETKLIELENKVNDLYRRQFGLLNELCNEYFDKKNASDAIRKTLYKDYEKVILSLRSTKSYQQLLNSVNKNYDNIAYKLSTFIPEVKSQDQKILVLAFAGLSVKAICVICGIEYGNYYVKRQRIREKIQQSNNEFRDEVLKSFFNATGDSMDNCNQL